MQQRSRQQIGAVVVVAAAPRQIVHSTNDSHLVAALHIPSDRAKPLCVFAAARLLYYFRSIIHGRSLITYMHSISSGCGLQMRARFTVLSRPRDRNFAPWLVSTFGTNTQQKNTQSIALSQQRTRVNKFRILPDCIELMGNGFRVCMCLLSVCLSPYNQPHMINVLHISNNYRLLRPMRNYRQTCNARAALDYRPAICNLIINFWDISIDL